MMESQGCKNRSKVKKEIYRKRKNVFKGAILCRTRIERESYREQKNMSNSERKKRKLKIGNIFKSRILNSEMKEEE